MTKELIDRLGVIKALDEAKIKTTSKEYDRIIDVIGSMPTIEERKVGAWHIQKSKPQGILFPHCSCCEWCNTNWIKYPYCPNCGAKMEGAEE